MYGSVQTGACTFWYELGQRKKWEHRRIAPDPHATDGGSVAFLKNSCSFQFQSRRNALNNPRILFVDDHDDTRFMIKEWLSQFNYEVATAESIAGGLQLAKAEPFDVYILDTRFPGGRGAELCAKIREFDPATPIIFYSGESPEWIGSDLKNGAQEYVMKPEFDNLEKAILRAVKPVRA
jgi:CheY-like chemotaxis protein